VNLEGPEAEHDVHLTGRVGDMRLVLGEDRDDDEHGDVGNDDDEHRKDVHEAAEHESDVAQKEVLAIHCCDKTSRDEE
jgi:hypothetical protein